MILVERSKNFKLAVQLHNGKTNKFIKAELIETITNTVINTQSLNHVDGGLYINNSIVANTDGVFLVRYTVYNDAGLSVRDRRYIIKMDYIRVESIIEQLTEVVDAGDGFTV